MNNGNVISCLRCYDYGSASYLYVAISFPIFFVSYRFRYSSLCSSLHCGVQFCFFCFPFVSVYSAFLCFTYHFFPFSIFLLFNTRAMPFLHVYSSSASYLCKSRQTIGIILFSHPDKRLWVRIFLTHIQKSFRETTKGPGLRLIRGKVPNFNFCKLRGNPASSCWGP